MLTRLAPVAYDPAAECPKWQEFLQQIFCEDDALIRYVQDVIGYTLTGVVAEKALFILYGAGHNGKSVFLESLRALLGEYAAAFSSEALVQHKHSRHPADLSVLAGRRLAYAQETAEGSRLNESLVKALTGGDTISVRFMHANPFEMTPTFKVFLSTNSKPLIYEQSSAIWDRVKPIPFRYRVSPKDRVPIQELVHRFAIAEGSGVLRWAVEGCQRYLSADRLAEPAVVVSEVAQYRREMDVLGRFLAEVCVEAEGQRVPKTLLYKRYRDWCLDNGHAPVSSDTSAASWGSAVSPRGASATTEPRPAAGATSGCSTINVVQGAVGLRKQGVTVWLSRTTCPPAHPAASTRGRSTTEPTPRLS